MRKRAIVSVLAASVLCVIPAMAADGGTLNDTECAGVRGTYRTLRDFYIGHGATIAEHAGRGKTGEVEPGVRSYTGRRRTGSQSQADCSGAD